MVSLSTNPDSVLRLMTDFCHSKRLQADFPKVTVVKFGLSNEEAHIFEGDESDGTHAFQAYFHKRKWLGESYQDTLAMDFLYDLEVNLHSSELWPDWNMRQKLALPGYVNISCSTYGNTPESVNRCM